MGTAKHGLETMNSVSVRSLFDTEMNIKTRALIAVALAGAVGNSLGFLANLFLYGMNFVTGFCFLCAVLIICNLFFGLKSKHGVFLGYLMLAVLDVLEFPLLTLTYGAVMYPYLIIGFHAVVIVSEKSRRTLLCTLLGIYDIAVIVYSSLTPYIFGPQDAIGLLGSAVITFGIAIFTEAALVIMWQNVSYVENTQIDPVTKTLSRIGFYKKTEKILNADPAGEYILLFFNVVSFKTINSLFGVEGGNRFLCAAADRLANAPFCPSVVGRTSTDHFACLVKKAGFDRSCLERVCQMPYTDMGLKVNVLLYCGVYEITDRSLPVSSMYDRACSATSFLHSSGSKFYAEYDKVAESSYCGETEVIGQLDKAIDNGQFQPFYQPIVECATGKIVSAEALARWIHPEMGMISPAVFIPTLEKKDMVSALDRIIACKVHSLLKQRLTEERRVIPVSVNLSRMDLYDTALMDELNKMLREMPEGNKLHRFEITESTYEDMSAYTLDVVSALRNAGASILIDDFGSGFSSLGMITDYEFDIIKLDIQFASKIVGNDRVRIVVQSLVDMAHKIGSKVVAEGVENKEQYLAVKECGCDYVQGYYFYKPLPEDKFLELLDS